MNDMTFREYKRKDSFNKPFIEEIAKITMSHTTTVSRWLNGKTIPPVIKQRAIAKYLNQPVEVLFPQNK